MDSRNSEDVNALDKMSADNLVALLQKRDKQFKTLQEKAAAAEKKHITKLKQTKILRENRAAFLRFISQFASDCDVIFEEAIAREVPVSRNLLESKMAYWIQLVKDGEESKRDIDTLLELIWPQEKMSDIDATELQKRWVQFEEDRANDLQTIVQRARESVVTAEKELQQHEEAKQAQKAIEQEVLVQMQSQQSHQAQELLGLLRRSSRGVSLRREVDCDMAEVQALEEEIKAIESNTDAFHKKCHQEDVRCRLAIHQQEQEIEALKGDASKQLSKFHRALEEKAQASVEKQKRKSAALRELDAMRKLKHTIDTRAGRFSVVKAREETEKDIAAKIEKLNRELEYLKEKENNFKLELRSLEGSISPEKLREFEYMRELILKYAEYAQAGDTKRTQLIPAIGLALQVTDDQLQRMERKMNPSWLALNEAVGRFVQRR